MRLIVSQHDLNRHVQSLRNCFGPGVVIHFETTNEAAGIKVRMTPSEKTYVARSERGYDENTIMISYKMGKQSVLLSYSESWSHQRKQVQFESAGFRIYICPDIETASGTFKQGIPHQLMRLEWESKNMTHEKGHWIFPAGKAAHPHLQFDRCNLAFADMQDEVSFSDGDEVVVEFSERDPIQRHTNLTWFSKLHFPMQAPWSDNPYDGEYEDGSDVPHAKEPKSLAEINQWVTSVARYVREQFENYID